MGPFIKKVTLTLFCLIDRFTSHKMHRRLVLLFVLMALVAVCLGGFGKRRRSASSLISKRRRSWPPHVVKRSVADTSEDIAALLELEEIVDNMDNQHDSQQESEGKGSFAEEVFEKILSGIEKHQDE